MAVHSRLEVLDLLTRTGLVPLFYDADVETAKAVVGACRRGGARLIEFTNRGDFAHEVFGELRRFCREAHPDLALGVGSVADAGTAALYVQLGADFVVTPSLREDVGRVCNRRKVAWVPGCTTLSEIGRAEELGAEVVKLFPGELLGPDFVRALRGPQPWTSVMVTGGVTAEPENLRAWFEAGVTAVGMGSKLISREAVAAGDWAGLEARVRGVVGVIGGRTQD